MSQGKQVGRVFLTAWDQLSYTKSRSGREFLLLAEIRHSKPTEGSCEADQDALCEQGGGAEGMKIMLLSLAGCHWAGGPGLHRKWSGNKSLLTEVIYTWETQSVSRLVPINVCCTVYAATGCFSKCLQQEESMHIHCLFLQSDICLYV